jgi:DNA-binding transcriptional ArsR family regulator
MRILASLREHGPATASELGRRLGESSGSTSYHLRQLERYEFVGDDDDQPSRRERRWKAFHTQTNVKTDSFMDSEAGRALLDSAVRYNVEYLLGNVDEYLRGDFTPEWRPVLGVNDYLLRLTRPDAEELVTAIGELLEGFRSRASDSPDAMFLAWHLLVLPKKQQ